MSGVRIVNEELRSLGMTLPGFLERGKVISSLPSLGLLTLAGLTPDDWEIRYCEVDEFDAKSLDRNIADGGGLIAISSLSARILDAYALADNLRRRGNKVVIGGLHASVLPREAADHADAVVVGEGEGAWRQVLADFEQGSLQPYYQSARTRDFQPWAVPRFDMLDPSRYNRITIQTTRGCPLDCSFCAASRLISRYKLKPIERVKQEIEAITRLWAKPFLELADDNTFVQKKWSRELVETIGSYGIRWFTESDISLADDDELLRSVAESGCAQVLIGLETTCEPALGETDTRKWKQGRASRYRDAIQKIQEHGISVNGCFILGFDNHTPDAFEATSRFIEDSGLAEVQLTVLTPFPGTELHRRLESQGRLIEPVFWDKCTLFDVVFRPLQMTVTELEQGFRDLVRETYSPEKTLRRKSIQSRCLRSAARMK